MKTEMVASEEVHEFFDPISFIHDLFPHKLTTSPNAIIPL